MTETTSNGYMPGSSVYGSLQRRTYRTENMSAGSGEGRVRVRRRGFSEVMEPFGIFVVGAVTQLSAFGRTMLKQTDFTLYKLYLNLKK